jgi:hypothetical protein
MLVGAAAHPNVKRLSSAGSFVPRQALPGVDSQVGRPHSAQPSHIPGKARFASGQWQASDSEMVGSERDGRAAVQNAPSAVGSSLYPTSTAIYNS